MKIIQLSDWPINEIYKEIQNGKHIDRHNTLYGYDALLNEGFDVITVYPGKMTVLSRSINYIGRKFGYTNTFIQLRCLILTWRNRDIQAIYCHMLQFTAFLSTMRKKRFLRIPLITISHDALSEKQSNLKVWQGIDRVLTLGEKTLKLCIEKANIPERHRNYIDWGADLDFCSQYTQKERRSLDFILATGIANRDYDLLIEVFKDIPELNLRIFSSTYQPIVSLPSNVIIDNQMTRSSTNKLLPFYYNSLATVIPLKQRLDFCNGASILFESMAMKRPVIITDSKANLVDVEKEKIGFNIEFNDKKGWVDAIRYLQAHPNEAEEMGERGYKLANEKYNYMNFCNQLIVNINWLILKDINH